MKGSAGIPILQLVVLNRLIERMTKAPTGFFRSLFSSFQNDSDAITWEVVFGSGGMTPFVAPGSPAPTVGFDGVGEGSAKGAYWKEKIFFDEVFLNNLRSPGTQQTYEKKERQLARGLAKLQNRCERRREWMCAQMLINGGFSYQDSKNTKFTVNYGVPATHNVALATDRKWGSAGGSARNPLEDILDGRQIIKDDCGGLVNYAVLNSELLKDLMFDKNIQDLLSKSAFGNGDLFARPREVLGALLGIDLTIYDEFYEVQGWITQTVSSTTIYVDDATDFEIGGIARFINMTSQRIWEDRVITGVDRVNGTITVDVQPSIAMKGGRDKVVMKKKFIDDNKFMMFASTVEGQPIGEFLEAPHGNNRQWGMKVSTWEENDPEGIWIMVADKGLPVLFNPDATYVMAVK